MAKGERQYLDIISGKAKGALPAVARALLQAAEVPYASAMDLRNSLYDRGVLKHHDLGRPCISVGNLTAGGTGKTPVVQWLAGNLLARSSRPAVLMRGYRKAGSDASDEQQMLQAALPGLVVVANPDRVAAARSLLAERPEITHLILDDGLQHRRAGRDFNLVLINAQAPFGFGHVHPRGLLRERLSGLARADAVLVTHATEIPTQQLTALQDAIRRHTAAPVFQCDHIADGLTSTDGLHTLPLDELSASPFVLFTGIGHPESLSSRLRAMKGFRSEIRFTDHHHYRQDDLAMLREEARRGGATVLVTTEKDWAKLRPLWTADLPILYRVRLRLQFAPEHEVALLAKIHAVLGA